MVQTIRFDNFLKSCQIWLHEEGLSIQKSTLVKLWNMCKEAVHETAIPLFTSFPSKKLPLQNLTGPQFNFDKKHIKH